MGPLCPYCQTPTVMVSGRDIYPQHSNLWARLFFRCANCPDVYVGTHRKTGKPLGTPANSRLRQLRIKVHAAFDPSWRDKHMPRAEAYEKLQALMGLSVDECHIAKFDEEQCTRALELLRENPLC